MWWHECWMTVQAEFSDLGDAADITRVVVRLTVAVVLGAMLGYERESVGASAGLRTHMLVSLGSALFVLIPLQAGMSVNDVSRVLQGVTAGVGFLGAGAILKQESQNQITGLTTAAGVWLTAAIGVAAGMGREGTAVLSAIFALVILSLLRFKTARTAGADQTGSALNGPVDDAGPRN
jgi:putative Mg2+ transporter-C (MgtC) family protein